MLCSENLVHITFLSTVHLGLCWSYFYRILVVAASIHLTLMSEHTAFELDTYKGETVYNYIAMSIRNLQSSACVFMFLIQLYLCVNGDEDKEVVCFY